MRFLGGIIIETLLGEGVYGQGYKGKYGRKEVVIKEMKFDGAILNWAKDNQSKFVARLVMSNY